MSEIVQSDICSATAIVAPHTNRPTEVQRDESVVLRDKPPNGWPEPVAGAALYGVLGDFVRVVDPHTEADPISILLQCLVAVGNVVGRNPYFRVEATRHYLNLFLALVGDTSKARKGTSWGHVDRLMKLVEGVNVPGGWSDRIVSGLSSGEGLIWEIRDALRDRDTPDMGVNDKRRVVLDGEFAATLKVLRREGNTLSPVIRNAWDTGDLRILTKNSPAVATGAHISIVGHITRDELKRELTSTEMANGFANRFLWACVRRSKLLPEGGSLRERDLEPIVVRLRDALGAAHGVGEMIRDEGAGALWRRVYADLSAEKPGMVGGVIARAEAQIIRLACLYALLDHSTVIRLEHLEAAIALWNYCEASAQFIFGGATGDPVSDPILEALRNAGDAGMSRTNIRDLLGRNKSKERIDAALALLEDRRLAERRVNLAVSGRLEIWVARQ
jgi:hypothetical protein